MRHRTDGADLIDVRPTNKQQIEVEIVNEYTYDGIEFWDIPQTFLDGLSQREKVATMAKPETDMDAFVHSELGKAALGVGRLMRFGGIASPKVAEYWAKLGMVHEAHDTGDADRQWTSLVPTELEEGKTYPLLFVWHGHENPVLLAEGYGFGELAAERGWMVVHPWAANNDLYLEEFDRILAYMEERYPVDTNRIYTTGFSKGGRVSAHLALERTNVLAAAAPNATTAAASFYNPDGTELELTGPQQLTSADFASATHAIPMQFCGGDLDVYGAMPYDTDYKVEAVNEWLRLMGIDHKQELGKAGDSAAEQAIGLTFDEVEEVEQDGTTYYVGSYLDANGVATLRLVDGVGAVHWPTPYMSQVSCEFLEQFGK